MDFDKICERLIKISKFMGTLPGTVKAGEEQTAEGAVDMQTDRLLHRINELELELGKQGQYVDDYSREP